MGRFNRSQYSFPVFVTTSNIPVAIERFNGFYPNYTDGTMHASHLGKAKLYPNGSVNISL